jgi:hypothetical protein
MGAKASDFEADSGLFSSRYAWQAHRFFCFSATLREQKPLLPSLEAKRRALSRGAQLPQPVGSLRPAGMRAFCTASKAIVHHRSNEMARINSIESANALGCVPQIGVWVLACTKY